MRFLSVNNSAFLIELADLEETLALFDRLQQEIRRGEKDRQGQENLQVQESFQAIVEIIPAARTLLVRFDPAFADENTLETQIAGLKLEKGQQKSGKLVEIPVVYDGEDIDDVAALLKIDREEVIRRHTESHYQVAFCGFAPGFAYLTGGDPIFNVPRRASPRKSIPAGSVALAGKFGGVYPQPSPGGWQLIGRTDVKMFDLDREPPSLLKPGDRVHFVDVTKDYSAHSKGTTSFSLSRKEKVGTLSEKQMKNDRIEIAEQEKSQNFFSPDDGKLLPDRSGSKALKSSASTKAAEANEKASLAKTGGHDDNGRSATEATPNPQENAVFKLVTTLMPVTFQDRGRLYQSLQGLSPSGALDQKAMANANRLVGNAREQPVLEFTYGNARIKALQPSVIAFTGANLPITIKSAKGKVFVFEKNIPLAIDEGDEIILGRPLAGFRSYMALRGGFKVEPVLKSASFDSLSNLGPKPLSAGDNIFIANDSPLQPVLLSLDDPYFLPKAGDKVVLDVVMGPRTDWFTEQSIEMFFEKTWQVTPASNRIGIRLQSDTRLERSRSDELPSEGTVTGAIEVPANGEPVLFLRDRPVTGGYPVIANLVEDQIDLAAQIPIGAFIKFRAVKNFYDSEQKSLKNGANKTSKKS
ncbi:5-oxoprolinase subunit PxpB [Bartonella sp. W8098]|uniref:5-oxoprolinase subunit PxpB n=1 Tax=Bartonella TaxID=773 RepID=UPI0018DC599C|nr:MULTISPECIES: 5-oxoprolinase subunit PxpB [Bartonella]MBH9987668.1 5-oxoprolinase subunit PxpB [Bartonella apis]MBI0171324.1 5-oxoprolinase subunit PxpB [Bartonella sp. W8151]